MSPALQLRAVRAHFGFSQQALAVWLGMGRAQLASIETGREALPARLRPWLRPWVAALALPDATPAPALPPLPAPAGPTTGPAPVLARLAECHYQALRLGQQHAALLARQARLARHLAAGPLLQAALPVLPALPNAAEATALARRRRWLARLLEAAADGLAPEAATGPVTAALLAARAQAYRHEALQLRAWLAGIVVSG